MDKKLTVTVDNRLRVSLADLRALLGDDEARILLKQFEHKNPAHAKQKAMGRFFTKEPAVITTWSMDKETGEASFPRGGTKRLRSACESAGVDIEWKDRRVRGEMLEGETHIPDHSVVLWPHQERALQSLLVRQNCLLRSGTGSGKTTVGIALAARLKLPTIVILRSGALLKQWEKRCCDELGLRARDIGIIREGKRRLCPITLAMQETLFARGVDEELQRTFGVVILDECQGSPARTVFQAVDPFPARYRIGISADERRKDGREFLAYDLFGEVAADIPAGELEKAGVIVPVIARVLITKFAADWYADGTPDERDFGALLDAMAGDDVREEQVRATVEQLLAQGRQVLVFTQRIEHAVRFDTFMQSIGVRCGLLLGGKPREKEFARTTAGLADGSVRVGVGTIQAMGTGLDFPAIDAGVLALPIGNNPFLFRQVRGRLCRGAPGKTRGELFVLYDERVFGRSMLRNMDRWNDRNVTVGKSTVKEYTARHSIR